MTTFILFILAIAGLCLNVAFMRSMPLLAIAAGFLFALAIYLNSTTGVTT